MVSAGVDYVQGGWASYLLSSALESCRRRSKAEHTYPRCIIVGLRSVEVEIRLSCCGVRLGHCILDGSRWW